MMKTISFGLIFCTLFYSSVASFLPGQCNSKSCLNGATCYKGPQDNTHWCSCIDGFSGSRCEDRPCPDICQNNGRCQRIRKFDVASGTETDDFTCVCPLGYEGAYCDRPVRDSVCRRDQPCGSHGRCQLVNSINDYECHCHKGWTGHNCSIRDSCPAGLCLNGGSCRSNGTGFFCDCPATFRGSRCQDDVDECTLNPCLHGSCINKYGTFECECEPGFDGTRCELPSNSLVTTGRCSSDVAPLRCRNGGVCIGDGESCLCPSMYHGQHCEHDVNECDVYAPCENGGTCVNTDGGYACICANGFEGENCSIDRDDCAGSPCQAGGVCVDGLAMYTCQCPPGRTGHRCELEDRCETRRPCHNGRCITDVSSGDYTCECDRGFQGNHCDEDVDECQLAGELCYNNGTCVNTPGGYHCDCAKPFLGTHCDQLMSSCEPSPCLNHGTCIDHIESFVCVCRAGFTGDHCEIHGVTCPEQPCVNGGVCDNDVCICPRGFTGMFCEERGIPCGMQTCPISSVCIEGDGESSAVCGCPIGYYGIDCQLRKPLKEDCSSNPCLHGSCNDTQTGYQCQCPKGYTGRNCEDPVNHCTPFTCSHGGSCVHHTDGYTCHCPSPYHGKNCEIDSDPCASANCSSNSFCVSGPEAGHFSCRCDTGYRGENCDEDINECLLSPCRNGGRCENTVGSYECVCPHHYGGIHCEKNIDYCHNNPCSNNGTCISDINGFRCLCPSGFSGKTCKADIDDCLPNPCRNGALCFDGVDSYRCQCPAGFSGRDCQINVDECRPKGLCLNGGRCVDGIASYRCDCTRGYAGTNCQYYVDIDQYNATDVRERLQCAANGCTSKAGDGRCDAECNLFGCGFDGGDCSARTATYDICPQASYCARVFKDGKCDQICNTEACLFDGFDCERRPSPVCREADFCQRHFGDGTCDRQCDNLACGYDGGDCERERKQEQPLSGDVVLVVLSSPEEFVEKVNRFLMSLSAQLRASVRITSDSEGPMVFKWEDGVTGERVELKKNQVLSVSFGGVVRSRRSASLRGVAVWVSVDVASCRGDCFTDVDVVASYLGRAQAQQELSSLGMPLYEAIARHPDHTPGDSGSSTFFAILLTGVGMMMVVASVFVLQQQQQQRTRKRRMIDAPIWMPPTESQHKNYLSQQADHSLRQSLYMPHGDAYSSIKRTKLDGPMMNFYSDRYDTISAPPVPPLPLPNNNVVVIKPKTKKIPNPATDLHLQAESMDAISLPIDVTLVNTPAGPCWRTPLLFLAANCTKDKEILCVDVDNLIAAGANINYQDDDDETALFIAVRMDRLELVQKLLTLGADPCRMNTRNSTALHQAASLGNTEIVEELLKYQAVRDEINEVDIEDRTALMVNVLHNRPIDVAAILIKHGADPSFPGDKSARTYRGRTALHYAALYENVEMIRFLVDQGANKDAQDLEDCTPLFLAAQQGTLRSVEALIEAGASLDITDQKERTPRAVAEDRFHHHVVDALAKARGGVSSMPIYCPKPPANTKPKATAKRVAPKRKPQPLTPPHSDGTATPSPSEAFQLGRPLLAVFHSPENEMTSLGAKETDGYSPQGAATISAHSGLWPSPYLKPSPPYDEQASAEFGLGATSFYDHTQSFGDSYDSTPYYVPSCQYEQQQQQQQQQYHHV